MDFFDKLKALCDEKGISITTLPEKIPGRPFSPAAIFKWKHGSAPRVETIKAIADFFGVPVSYFKDGDTNSHNTINGSGNVIGNGNTILTLSAQENALLDLFRSLDVIGQAKVLTYAAEQKKTGHDPDQM